MEPLNFVAKCSVTVRRVERFPRSTSVVADTSATSSAFFPRSCTSLAILPLPLSLCGGCKDNARQVNSDGILHFHQLDQLTTEAAVAWIHSC